MLKFSLILLLIWSVAAISKKHRQIDLDAQIDDAALGNNIAVANDVNSDIENSKNMDAIDVVQISHPHSNHDKPEESFDENNDEANSNTDELTRQSIEQQAEKETEDEDNNNDNGVELKPEELEDTKQINHALEKLNNDNYIEFRDANQNLKEVDETDSIDNYRLVHANTIPRLPTLQGHLEHATIISDNVKVESDTITKPTAPLPEKHVVRSDQPPFHLDFLSKGDASALEDSPVNENDPLLADPNNLSDQALAGLPTDEDGKQKAKLEIPSEEQEISTSLSRLSKESQKDTVGSIQKLVHLLIKFKAHIKLLLDNPDGVDIAYANDALEFYEHVKGLIRDVLVETEVHQLVDGPYQPKSKDSVMETYPWKPALPPKDQIDAVDNLVPFLSHARGSEKNPQPSPNEATIVVYGGLVNPKKPRIV